MMLSITKSLQKKAVGLGDTAAGLDNWKTQAWISTGFLGGTTCAMLLVQWAVLHKVVF